MSLAMKVSRRGRYGDPGIFGFLGGVVKTVTGVAGAVLPGPLGTVAKTLSNALPGKNLLQPSPRPGPGTTLAMPTGNMPVLTLPGTPTVGLPGTGFGVPVPTSAPMTGMEAGSGGMVACKPGYRMNKSKYFTERDVFGVKTGGVTIHQKGTTCVKSRRMNPLNPRAISRAIRRLESAKRATSRLSRVSIRGGCGCK